MSAKKKVETQVEAPEKVKAPVKSVERKIDKSELLQLQKDGKLKTYDPATGMGTVLTVGNKITWPGGETEIK